MARTPAIRYGTVMDIAMTLATGPLAPLLRDGDLPGPMNLNRLADFGTLCKLDSANAYTLQDSTTLYGRATIVATVIATQCRSLRFHGRMAVAGRIVSGNH